MHIFRSYTTTVLSFFNKYMYRFIPLGIALKRNMDRVIPIYPQRIALKRNIDRVIPIYPQKN